MKNCAYCSNSIVHQGDLLCNLTGEVLDADNCFGEKVDITDQADTCPDYTFDPEAFDFTREDDITESDFTAALLDWLEK